MKHIKISTIEDLIDCLNRFENNYFFRGHANANWQLESSLERVIGKNWTARLANKIEEYSLKMFTCKYHLYAPTARVPQSKLEWMATMQHYGVPTRLVDFTTSPYVALYFAIEMYDLIAKPNIAIIAIDYRNLTNKSIDLVKERDVHFTETYDSVSFKHDKVFDDHIYNKGYEIAWIAEPSILNARLDRQAGSFLLPGTLGVKIQDVLSSPIYNDVDMAKIEIDAQLVEQVFVLLRKMNITSKSIYGDIDGLAKSIKMEMQIYSQTP